MSEEHETVQLAGGATVLVDALSNWYHGNADQHLS